MPTHDSYNIKKPLLKDDKWLIFPESIFSHISTMDCTDAMEGKCYTDKSFNECIDMCDKSPECNYGYYISNLPAKNICIPLRDRNINSNPVYRIRNKNIYQEMENANSRVFVNKLKYPFPPEQANTLFYQDNVTIKNMETGYLLETSPLLGGDDGTHVTFSKTGDLIVQVLQVPPDLSSGTQYVSVKYGDTLVFNIPNTSLIMKESISGNKMEWDPRDYTIAKNISYTLYPITQGKQIGDNVSYSDVFSIHTKDSILGIDPKSLVEKLYHTDYKQARDKGHNITFKFTPKMKGWYCDNDAICKEIPLEKIHVNNKGIGTYNGLAVGRNPGCFGVCKYKIKDQPHLYPFDKYTDDPKHGNNDNTINVWAIIIISILLLGYLIFLVISKNA